MYICIYVYICIHKHIYVCKDILPWRVPCFPWNILGEIDTRSGSCRPPATQCPRIVTHRIVTLRIVTQRIVTQSSRIATSRIVAQRSRIATKTSWIVTKHGNTLPVSSFGRDWMNSGRPSHVERHTSLWVFDTVRLQNPGPWYTVNPGETKPTPGRNKPYTRAKQTLHPRETLPQATRWSTTLSAKVSLPHTINSDIKFGANWVT